MIILRSLGEIRYAGDGDGFKALLPGFAENLGLAGPIERNLRSSTYTCHLEDC
jgi:hypothetical protein